MQAYTVKSAQYNKDFTTFLGKLFLDGEGGGVSPISIFWVITFFFIRF